MDQEVVIVGTDGTEHVFPPGFDPKKAAAIVSSDAPLAPDPRVVAEQERLTAPSFGRQVLQSGVDNAKGISERALIGMAAGKVIPMLPKAAQKILGILSSPAAGGAIGAAEGYRRGGLSGAVAGGASGYATSKGLGALAGRLSAPDVAGGMSQSGRAAQATQSVSEATGVNTPMLDALMRGAKYDELAALVPPKAGVPGPALKAVPAASALEAELMARETLGKPINWRTQDVTPLKKPGQGIHFGEESTPGLLKLLQDALVAKNRPLAEEIQTAIRQRSHITGKMGGP